MNVSPSISHAYKNFSMLKKTLGLGQEMSKYFGILFIVYPIVVIFCLLYFRPSIVMTKDRPGDQVDKLSISKVVLWFVIFISPLLIYLILCR